MWNRKWTRQEIIILITAVCAVPLVTLAAPAGRDSLFDRAPDTSILPENRVSAAAEFTVQVGSFNDRVHADQLAGYLQGIGLEVRRLQRSPDRGRGTQVVAFGSYQNLSEARHAARNYQTLARRDAFGVDIATVW